MSIWEVTLCNIKTKEFSSVFVSCAMEEEAIAEALDSVTFFETSKEDWEIMSVDLEGLEDETLQTN